MENNERWLEWAIEIQAISQAGIHYSKDVFDTERYERLREIAIEILDNQTTIPADKIKEIFASDKGYQTPKVSTRAVIFKDDRLLMVQENSGKWTMPGGFCDVNQTVVENTIKETKEETGLDVKEDYVMAVNYKDSNNGRPLADRYVEVYLVCDVLGGEFVENIETIAVDYFTLDEIYELEIDKVGMEMIEMAFESNNSRDWKTRIN